MLHGSACLSLDTDTSDLPLGGGHPVDNGNREDSLNRLAKVRPWPRVKVKPRPDGGVLDSQLAGELPRGHHAPASHQARQTETGACSQHAVALAETKNRVKPPAPLKLREAKSASITLISVARRGTDLTDEQNERVRAAIRAYMAEAEMTGTVMAKRLGLSSASLSNILSGKNGAGTRTAMRLAQLAGLPHETFVSVTSPVPPSVESSTQLLADDPRSAGFRRFSEFVEDDLPELRELLVAFRAERFDGVQYRMAKNESRTRLDWETQWKSEFRAWRRARESGAVVDAFPKGSRAWTDDDDA